MRSDFAQRGYVILREFLEPGVVEGVREELSLLVDGEAYRLIAEGKIQSDMRSEPFETRIGKLFEDCMEEAPNFYRPQLHGAKLFHLFFHPRLLDVVQLFLGDEVRLYPNYTSRPKFPEHEATLVLWHQDGGYTATQSEDKVDLLRMVNVWAPLVPARRQNGCMQFVPGTHTLGIVPHERREYYLEIPEEEMRDRIGDAVDVVVDPGDVVLFHNLLFHRGLPNLSTTVRWSMDWRYQDAGQPTMRPQKGHLARSLANPEEVVKSPEDWASRVFQ